MNKERIGYTFLNGIIASASGILLMSLAMSSLHSDYHYIPGAIGSRFPYSYATLFSVIAFTLFFAIEPKINRTIKALRKVTATWYVYAGLVVLFGTFSNIILNLGFEIVSPEPKILAEIRFQSAITLFLAIGCIICWPLFLLNILIHKKST
ncbi:MAG: hypothetical protein CXR31_15720 [Geobacter sp.]|nr:MAG: hypothetical protein CXR31_15720 [Geobacter sp.]